MESAKTFAWPEGKRLAVSLTFDDARDSQADIGLPLLNAQGVKASFYVTLQRMEARLDDWRKALADGHEIGNHTVSHPCSGNFLWARKSALEEYTLERMEEELTGASAKIEELTGRKPQTFAYPCGQKFVGRGRQVQSYVGLVAKHFLVGRGFRDEAPNDPTYCDLAQAAGVDLDGLTFAQCQEWLDKALAVGGWLIFAGHEVGAGGIQTVRTETLDALCRYCLDAANGVWIDTVARIGAYVRQAQEAPKA
ncbi:MAG TPA: polysaccharide deacetylase family protein [Chthonomonadaceae bacterium]|nr:polysaccharide deacetylase family protein [Chthonomonadaceae bacterium]